jgi:hypothetical protein
MILLTFGYTFHTPRSLVQKTSTLNHVIPRRACVSVRARVSLRVSVRIFHPEKTLRTPMKFCTWVAALHIVGKILYFKYSKNENASSPQNRLVVQQIGHKIQPSLRPILIFTIPDAANLCWNKITVPTAL